jgi:DNA-binding transcriptional LysR family regulator
MIIVMNIFERLTLDTDLLQTFVAIAECKNLTLAASRLGRTQSAISVQLKKLETGLGAALFVRTARGMILTPSGETLLTHARPLLSEIRHVAQLFKQPLTGSIRVGLPDDFDDIVLERILSEFARAHPNVQVLVQSGCTARYPTAIKSGVLDIAVCSGIGDLGGIPLGSQTVVWAGRKGQHWPSGETIPLAILDRECFWRDLPMKTLDEAGIKHRAAFQSSSFASLQAALRSGVAVGILQEQSLTEELRAFTKADGFPDLPNTRRAILTSEHAPKDLVAAMTDAIRAGLNA